MPASCAGCGRRRRLSLPASDLGGPGAGRRAGGSAARCGLRHRGTSPLRLSPPLLAQIGSWRTTFSPACPPRRWLRDILVFERTGSTNDFAGNLGRQGWRRAWPSLRRNRQQAAGGWAAPGNPTAGAGLWFSLLLRPAWPPALWTRLTLWAAWAWRRESKRATGAEATLKWPNDLYLGGRKLAGILVESSPAQGNAFAVAGIGLNVNQDPPSPPRLPTRATSLRIETGAPVERNGLAAAVLESAGPHLPRICPVLSRKSCTGRGSGISCGRNGSPSRPGDSHAGGHRPAAWMKMGRSCCGWRMGSSSA